MSTQMTTSNLLIELSTEEQELLSGGRSKGCYKKCSWYCPPRHGGHKNRKYNDSNYDRGDNDDDY
jgi:hypothetical protein